MGVERKMGKMVTSMGLSAGVEVSAGVETWLFDLKAALEITKGTSASLETMVWRSLTNFYCLCDTSLKVPAIRFQCRMI